MSSSRCGSATAARTDWLSSPMRKPWRRAGRRTAQRDVSAEQLAALFRPLGLPCVARRARWESLCVTALASPSIRLSSGTKFCGTIALRWQEGTDALPACSAMSVMPSCRGSAVAAMRPRRCALRWSGPRPSGSARRDHDRPGNEASRVIEKKVADISSKFVNEAMARKSVTLRGGAEGKRMSKLTLSLAEARGPRDRSFRAPEPRARMRGPGGALVAAEADGLQGHGLTRLAVSRHGAQPPRTRLVDAAPYPNRASGGPRGRRGEGFAYPAIDLAIDELAIARREGIGAANPPLDHCGIAGHHAERLAERGFVALVFAMSSAIAPWGGSEPAFGTTITAPRRRLPACAGEVDLSVSKVARSSIMSRRSARAEPSRKLGARRARPRDGRSRRRARRHHGALGGRQAVLFMVEVLAASTTGGICRGLDLLRRQGAAAGNRAAHHRHRSRASAMRVSASAWQLCAGSKRKARAFRARGGSCARGRAPRRARRRHRDDQTARGGLNSRLARLRQLVSCARHSALVSKAEGYS